MHDVPISNSREHVEAWLEDEYEGYDLDALTKAIYEARAQTPEEYTEERWGSIKQKFQASVDQCRAEAKRMIDEGEME